MIKCYGLKELFFLAQKSDYFLVLIFLKYEKWFYVSEKYVYTPQLIRRSSVYSFIVKI
jgi:hypothetical protein